MLDVDQSGGLPVSRVAAAIPEPPAKLSAAERKVWNHVTQALFEYGLIHKTDGIALLVIVRTFQRWVQAEEQLTRVMNENGGSYMVKTPNGFEQPHQIYYITKNTKKELLQWLPEAALTIPSFNRVVEAVQTPDQGNLFPDPVEAHRRRGAAMKLRPVGN